MSATGGDKARFGRERKAKIRKRERMRELKKQIAEKKPEAAS